MQPYFPRSRVPAEPIQRPPTWLCEDHVAGPCSGCGITPPTSRRPSPTHHLAERCEEQPGMPLQLAGRGVAALLPDGEGGIVGVMAWRSRFGSRTDCSSFQRSRGCSIDKSFTLNRTNFSLAEKLLMGKMVSMQANAELIGF
jgi:hypothetical protein